MAELIAPITVSVGSETQSISAARFVTYIANKRIRLPVGQSESSRIIGVTLVDYDSTSASVDSMSVIPILRAGKIDIESGAAVNEGDVIISDNTGRAVPTTTTPASNLPVGSYQNLGIALQSTASAGAIIEIALLPGLHFLIL